VAALSSQPCSNRIRSSLESVDARGGGKCLAASCIPSVQEIITSFDRWIMLDADLLITREEEASIKIIKGAGATIEGMIYYYDMM
jgi:hypothetical protein